MNISARNDERIMPFFVEDTMIVRSLSHAATLILAAGTLSMATSAQTFPTGDPVIKRIWAEGMENSQLYPLAQALLDSIGPRLPGSPGNDAAVQWLLSQYERWGISARKEQFGTWLGWRRGITHVDLIAPRVRTLEGTMLAWSPGTGGPVEGGAVIFPDLPDEAAFRSWLPAVRGKFVLLSFPEPTCRPDEVWERLATPESFERLTDSRNAGRRAWNDRFRKVGARRPTDVMSAIEEAGALGILTSLWSEGWGVNKVFYTETSRVPALDLSCEDYGLVFRLAENGQAPQIRLESESEFLGETPVFNVVAEMRGTEKPDEYVVLSAHVDSWDAASGATDNGTGTVMMLEAMRVLHLAYPSPKRTILVGHWGSEEVGLVGSGAFREDHPEVMEGLHALFNQDNGTWRIDYLKAQGLVGAGEHFGRWFSKIPLEIAQHIDLDIPGTPGQGSDHMSFTCAGAPGFRLQSHYPEYRQYTWHTNRDTFDKIVFDDLMNNATLAAMVAYLASEDTAQMPRDRLVPTEGEWPSCFPPRRSMP
jgi:hypothetical protein